MRLLSLTRKKLFLFFFLLLISNISIVFSNALQQSEINLYPNAGDESQIQSYAVAINSTNNIHAVFNKQIQIHNSLEYIVTGADFIWNLTSSIVIEENSTLNIIGRPTMVAASDRLQLVLAFSTAADSGLLLMEKPYSDISWSSNIVQLNETFQFLDPVLVRNTTNEDLWLCWRDNSEDSYKMFFSVFNSTSGIWGNVIKLTDPSGGNSTDCKFILDVSGNAHFVWSEGQLNQERILYRKVFWNGTMEPIEVLTDGNNRCRYPEIIIDYNNDFNVFWSNYTVVNPGVDYGTQNIQTTRKSFNGTWSEPFEIAPYKPPDFQGFSDARISSVAKDFDNNLWVAFEIREQYAYHQGIDIRKRVGYTDWQASERISLANNPAIDPLIKCDNVGNLHCFWLDLRHSNYELYFKIRFSSGVWTNEFRLSIDTSTFGDYWQLILIVSGVIAIISFPLIILDRIRARKRNKLLKRKISDLQE